MIKLRYIIVIDFYGDKTLHTLVSGLFSFNNFHFMRLTASLGFEAKYLVASAIAVYPANRNTDIAVFRIAALTCGMTPHRTGEASSPNIQRIS